MKSSMAENSFWLGAYLERLLQNIQILQNYVHLSTHNLVEDPHVKNILLRSLNLDHYLLIKPTGNEAKEELIEQYLVWAPQFPNSVRNCLERARFNARCIQQLLNQEIWDSFNLFYDWMTSKKCKELFREDKDTFFANVLQHVFTIYGLINHYLPREEPYHYIFTGFYLEQLSFTVNLIQLSVSPLKKEEFTVTPADKIPFWIAVLNIAEGKDLFLRKYAEGVNSKDIINYFLFDETFPSSCCFCLEKLKEMIITLRLESQSDELDKIEKILNQINLESFDSNVINTQFEKLAKSVSLLYQHFIDLNLKVIS